MLRRLGGWIRTLAKLVLLVLGYFWLGAAYKLVYAQTHDVTKFKGRIPIPYYQQQFILDALLNQTWMFGPDFRNYIGELPNLGTIITNNAPAALADYCRSRELQLTDVADRYPYSLFAEEALEDSYLFSQGASLLGLLSARERPTVAYASPKDKSWNVNAVPNTERATQLSRRLADTFPESSQAATALYRVAEAESQAGRKAEALTLYRRVLAEYPRHEQAESAAEALSRAAREAGRLEEARNYKRQALRAAERSARERFPGKALPAGPTLSVMGFRVELSGLELQLKRLAVAREMTAVADREAARVAATRSLDEGLKNDLKDRRERLDDVRNEIWVADLYEAVKVPLPGLAPRAREFPVSGTVLLEGKPFEGVEVMLAGGPQTAYAGERPGQGGISFARRARTDRKGRYQVAGVPAGTYFPVVAFQLRLADGRVIQPEGLAPLPPGNPPQAAVVDDRPVTLNPIRFRRALDTRTFGELPASGKGIRLEWAEWPGAVSYNVRVLPIASEMAPRRSQRQRGGQFDKRVPEAQREAFRNDPVLWSKAKLTATAVECPLLSLAPDNPPDVKDIQYEYQVTAYDAMGKALATNTMPLSRFFLSAAARDTMLKLKPPVRGNRSRQRRRGPLGRLRS